jgi:hypothetical protein
MKKYLTLLSFVLIQTVSFGQNNYQDVVYLKNGSIIRGVIIEQVPNKSIKVETADRNVFVYQMNEIEKLTKENANRDSRVLTSNKRKGFVGLSVGCSSPIGNFANKSNGGAKTGVQLNLVNFGYLFSNNFGIAASWFGASNPIDIYYYDGNAPWSYGGLMIGPLISFPISERENWDFKPMVGYSSVTLPDLGVGLGRQQATSISYSLVSQFRIHLGRKVSLLLSADYFFTKPKFKFNNIYYNINNIEQKIETLSTGVGVAYRIK